MFIDRLLGSWEQIDALPVSAKKLLIGDGSTEDLKNGLERCQIFKIQNVWEYMNKKGISVNDIPNIRPPFPWQWFEWNPLSDGDIKSIGVAIAGFKDYDFKDEYLDNIGVLFYEFKEAIIPACTLGWLCDEKGEYQNKIFGLSGLTEVKDNSDHDLEEHKFTKTGWSNILVALSAIAFIHCKNVIVKSNDYDAHLQRARIKRNKRPLLKYHTLEIRPMVKILREVGHSDTEGLKRALHICRGHFKEFTDKGLFGKYHGLYWWDAQVRGNETAGISLKDYKVSPYNGSPALPLDSESKKP